jgi:Bacteriophage lambda head decoration protein D
MPANDSFEFDYVPVYTKPTHEYGQPYGDEFHAEVVVELLLSTVAYSQRGVTLAGGQGVLPTGCVIARHTASGLYCIYQAGATDGRQNPAGILRDGRDTGGSGGTTLPGLTLSGTTTTYAASPAGKSATNALGNLVFRGTLNASLVSGTDTTGLVSGAQGLASGTMSTLGGRIMQWGGGNSSLPQAFPGSPMDGVPVSGSPAGTNAFIFLWITPTEPSPCAGVLWFPDTTWIPSVLRPPLATTGRRRRGPRSRWRGTWKRVGTGRLKPGCRDALAGRT